jgi:hypothetical protein
VDLKSMPSRIDASRRPVSAIPRIVGPRRSLDQRIRGVTRNGCAS